MNETDEESGTSAGGETARYDDSPIESETHPFEYAASDTPADRVGDFADELDGLRIRKLAAMRRAAARARSYALIGTVVSFVAGIKLLVMTIVHVRTWGWGTWPIGYVLFGLAAMMIAVHFGRRFRELNREVRTPAPLPPAPPEGPDFSTLSDGSQQWKNLEDIH